MPLFLAAHRPSAVHGPAQNPEVTPMSPQLLLPCTAARYGAKIHGEAVANGKHYLYHIADAADGASLRSYLAPFGKAGSLDVVGASR
ncbi:MAG: sulfite oxidase [Thermoplasmata archaeon]|jgi:hypothetical protein